MLVIGSLVFAMVTIIGWLSIAVSIGRYIGKTFVIYAFFGLFFYGSLFAQTIKLKSWPNDPAVNLPICIESQDQTSCSITSDGLGGAIITWQDYRSGSNYDIYAQRVDSSGDIQWTSNGVAICTATNLQSSPQILSDGLGGAIITWQDYRSGSNYDIYAQRVDSSGSVQWISNGVAICTAINSQSRPRIVSDNNNGAIITWQDDRLVSPNTNIYAQRVDSSGVVQWTSNGVAICTDTRLQEYPAIVSDSLGGAIITWQDFRSQTNYDIYAQRVNNSGVVQWTVNGIVICNTTNEQFNPQIASDGNNGAIITWEDLRFPDGIYAQRVNNSGVVQWTANGIVICGASSTQQLPQIVSDDAGGAIITWEDSRNGASNQDIYAQRVNSAGTVQWTANGVAISIASNNQNSTQIVSDGLGGAIITWRDYRNGSTWDIYAQRVNSTGSVQWTTDGIAISTASNNQIAHRSVSDGLGGAIITWQDYRSGSNYDIYAQTVTKDGALLIELLSFDAIAKDGYILLLWETATEIDNAGFHLWRSEKKDGEYTRITGFIIPSQGGPTQGARYEYRDFSIVPEKQYFYKLEDIDYHGQSTFHGPIATKP